ncbi:hypothetical protein SBDP2_1380001 [Syntrophobacter sp. SbD2]|nr:hypothetical protein SBDP2_1380001 [Syntrophobacter sp. SbD2]
MKWRDGLIWPACTGISIHAKTLNDIIPYMMDADEKCLKKGKSHVPGAWNHKNS